MEILTELEDSAIELLTNPQRFCWLDLTDPSSESLKKLQTTLEIHPLAIETLLRKDQRPKLEKFDNHILMVFYGAELSAEQAPQLFEVHCLIGQGYIITVHKSQQASGSLRQLHELLSSLKQSDEEFALYRILDVLASSFFPVLDSFDDRIDLLENVLLSEAQTGSLQSLFDLKRDLVTMRKIVTPQRDLLAYAVDEIATLPGFSSHLQGYFRHTYDQMLRVSDLIESYRDLLTGMLDVYLSTVSNRLNKVMERLTLVATVFLPLTFLTGFFGQNFGWMVDRVDTFAAFLVLGIGGAVLPTIGLLLFFKSRNYL